MIQAPVEMLFLETQKTMLLQDLGSLILDRALMKEVENFAWPSLSLQGIIATTILPGSGLRLAQENELRQKVAMAFPGALDKFNELVVVCNNIAQQKNSVIVN